MNIILLVKNVSIFSMSIYSCLDKWVRDGKVGRQK